MNRPSLVVLVSLLSGGASACDGRAVGPPLGAGPLQKTPPPAADARVDSWRDPPPTVTAPDLGPDATVVTPPPTAQTTTCVFLNDATHALQTCTAVDGPGASGECSGVGSCEVEVSAPWGTEILWKSTCGGYAYSYADDQGDTVGFDCTNDVAWEEVTCVFGSGAAKQWCATSGLPGPFRCSGVGSCTVNVLSRKGLKLGWSSSCAGAQQTTLDGVNEKVAFSCP